MADNDKDSKNSADTTKRVSTSFWGFADEIKDTVQSIAKIIARYGIGAAGIGLLAFTAEGRSIVEEAYHFVRLKFGEPIAATAYKWTMGGYLKLRNATIAGLAIIILAGLSVIFVFAHDTQIGNRAAHILPTILITFGVMAWYWASLAPLVFIVGGIVGALPGFKDTKFEWETVRSLPRFVISGLQGGLSTGLSWIEGLWRIVNKVIAFMSLGAIWYIFTPLHNDPAMYAVSAMVIPLLFAFHMAYRPTERWVFWWWVNWATAFTLGDITVWCMLPFLKVVFNLGVTPEYLSHHAQFADMNTWLETNEWLRVGATVLGIMLLGWQLAWTIRLANKSSRKGGETAVSSGGVFYQKAKPLPGNFAGWLITGLVICFIFYVVVRYELDLHHQPVKIVQKELSLANRWLPGFNFRDPLTMVDGKLQFKPITYQPRAVEGSGRYPDTVASLKGLGQNSDSFQVTLNPAQPGWQLIARTVARGDVVNYKILVDSYAADSSGVAVQIPLDGYRVNGQVVHPDSSFLMTSHCLTTNAPYGALIMRVGMEGRPQAMAIPAGMLTITSRGVPVSRHQQLAMAFNLAQVPTALREIRPGAVRVLVWIDRQAAS